jgi:hypothetical protein
MTAICLGAAGVGALVAQPRAGGTAKITAQPNPLPIVAKGNRALKDDQPQWIDGVKALPPGALARIGTVAFRTDQTHGAPVIGPDGKSLYVRTDRSPIYCWRVASGQLIASLEASGKYRRTPSAQFLPDGRLVSGGGDGTVRIWDLATFAETTRFEVPDLGMGSLSAASDGHTTAALTTTVPNFMLGYPGPQPQFNLREYSYVVPHYNIID